MKTNFKRISIEVAFDEFRELDIAKELGNFIHSHTSDIGLDDVAREIYHSDGEMEIEESYASTIIDLVKDASCPFLASVKRAIINELKG